MLDSYIFGDDFNTILAILEEEEELDEQVGEAADEVGIIIFFRNSQYSRKTLYFDFYRIKAPSSVIT